jgi:hypothetical protein
MSVSVSPEECGLMEEGHSPALLTIPDDSKALKSLLCLRGMTDAENVLASLKDAVVKGV